MTSRVGTAMTEAADYALIDRLRSEELDSIRLLMADGRRDYILKTLDERGRAQELVRQQYTGRYPFELLQNANDASGDSGTQGHTAKFLLTDKALVVADKGAGFGPAQVRAICGLGRSSKDPRKSIGYKGLGFKSVGEITDDPQVFSESFGFRFNQTMVRAAVEELTWQLHSDQRLPVYAFPFNLTPADAGSDAADIEELLAAGYRTVFRLPLRAGVDCEEVAQHLVATLTPRLLLFLDATDELQLEGTGQDFVATAARERNASVTEMLLESGGHTEHWLVFERPVDIPDHGLVASLGDAWSEVERVRVAAAVPLDAEGLPTRMEPQPLHVYFPTQEESGFGLIVQADFALELDRRRIATNPESAPFNRWLLSELAGLLGRDVAAGLAARYPDEAAVVMALSVVGSPSSLGTTLVEQVVVAMRDTAFVPTASGEARRPEDCLLLVESVPDPAMAWRMIHTAGLGALVLSGAETDLPARAMLTDRLDAEEMDLSAVLTRLRTPSDDDVNAYYEFLVAWSEEHGRTFAQALVDISCARTVSGRWRAPSERLFFPRQRDEVIFPTDLEVPIVDIPDVDGLRGLLDAAGVSSFEWRQLLPEFIFPLLTDVDTAEATRERALDALRLYYQTERSGDPRLRAQAAKVLLPARAVGDGKLVLRAAEEIYFPSVWTGRENLEFIYGPFGEPEFLAIEPPTDLEQRAQDQDFLAWLGVADRPRPDARVIEERNTHMLSALGRHPHARRYGQWWEQWRQRPDVRAASRCDQGHPDSQQLRASFGLDRFPELNETRSTERLGALWEELARGWAVTYQEATQARFYCQNTGHGGERARPTLSLMAMMLREASWAPCLRQGDVEWTRPEHAWRLTRDTPRRVAERVPALPATLDRPWAAAMSSYLGVVDAARPEPAHLVQLLNDLASDWNDVDADADAQDRTIADAARWAMRTLNDVLGDETAPRLGDGRVPLLARLDGQQIFHAHPYVAEDPALAETWESTFPILDADRDLRQLHAALALQNLDRLTTQVPVPSGARLEEQAAIRTEVDKALPYLAAVAVESVPSRTDDVFRGLARLEIEVCDELVVRYELRDQTRERGEVFAFITVRQEQAGIVRRNIGTAHLELDDSTGQPHWYVFGPLLARFLNVPTQGDAFSLLLAGNRTSRREYLRSRLIPEEILEQARIRLDKPPEDDDLTDLIGDLPVGGDEAEEDSEAAGTDPYAPDLSAHEDPAEPDEPEVPSNEASLDGGVEELPEVDHDNVEVVDAAVGSNEVEENSTKRRGGGGGGLGPAGPVDHERRQRLQRTIGSRGEQAVFEAERRRVAASGQDPDRVTWVSKTHPFAPYDIRSLDQLGHTMYIEVKSTTDDDPYTPFDISHAELLWGIKHRSHYYIYRVTEAHLAAPSIARFQDPMQLLADGSARLGLSGARLAFSPPP